MSGNTRAVVALIGAVMLLGGLAFGFTYPVKSSGWTCGSPFRKDYTDIDEAQKITDVAVGVNFDDIDGLDPEWADRLSAAAGQDADAADSILAGCNDQRQQLAVLAAIPMGLGVLLLLAAWLWPANTDVGSSDNTPTETSF